MSIEGSPRPWMEGVREADWSPDGSTLAIVHDMGSKDRLEYPIGTVLYETAGYVSDLRVSPDGTRVAFMDHQTAMRRSRLGQGGRCQRKVTTLAGEFWGEEGLAWSRDGDDGVLCRQRSASRRRGARPGRRDVSSAVGRDSTAPARPASALTSPGDFTSTTSPRMGAGSRRVRTSGWVLVRVSPAIRPIAISRG